MEGTEEIRPAKWGIMGTGDIAKRELVPAIKKSDKAQLFAIASRNIDRARGFAENFGIPHFHGSYRDLLKDPDVEFVYLPLPNHLHHKWVIESARKEKNVLCEKPIALEPAQVEDMMDVAEEYDVTVMEGFMYRFHPQTLRVKELIEKGRIGTPTVFRGNFSFPLLYCDRDDDIRWKEEMGGGSLNDLGTYSVNTARYTLGSEPTEVWGEQYYHPDHSAEAETRAILKFPNERVAIINSSFRLTEQAMYELVSGSGRIYAKHTYNPGEGTDITIEITKDGVHHMEPIVHENEYTKEIDHLVDCVRTDTTPKVSLQDSLNNTKVLDAIRRSARSEKWVKV